MLDLLFAANAAERIAIVGGPNAGKTTLANKLRDVLGRESRHTDSLLATHEWSDASAEVAQWMSEPGPWVIEGATTVRGLRKWMSANEGTPADLVIYLDSAKAPRSKGQETMAKGVRTVMAEILPELRARGVWVRVEP